MAVTNTTITHRKYGYSDRNDIDLLDIDVNRVNSNNIYVNHPAVIDNDMDDYFYINKQQQGFNPLTDLYLSVGDIAYITALEIYKLDNATSPPVGIYMVWVSTASTSDPEQISVWTEIYPAGGGSWNHTLYDSGSETQEKIHKYRLDLIDAIPVRWIKIQFATGIHKISKVRAIAAEAYDFFTILDENDNQVPISTSDKYYYLLSIPSGVPGTPSDSVHYKFKNTTSNTLYNVELYILYDPLVAINNLVESVEFSKDNTNWVTQSIMLNTIGYSSGVVPSGGVADFYIRLNIPEDATVPDSDSIIYAFKFYVKPESGGNGGPE